MLEEPQPSKRTGQPGRSKERRQAGEGLGTVVKRQARSGYEKSILRWITPLYCFSIALRRHPAVGFLVLSSAVLLLACAAYGIFFFTKTIREIDGSDLGAILEMEEPTKVYDRHGRLLYRFYEKNRKRVPLAQISRELQKAILAIEDRNFYQHRGYAVGSMLRAAVVNLSAGHIKQGGSTLTQQLTRSTFLTPKRSIKRKLQELWLASRVEHAYTKDQILELYANRVYLGSGYYGVEAAAQGYFGTSAYELTLEAAALLAGLIRAPTLYSPHTHPSLAVKRRNQVLDAMAECGFVTPRQADQAKRAALNVRPRAGEGLKDADYNVEYVKQQLLEMFGYDKTFNGGLRVYTTVDAEMQATAQRAIESHLRKIEAQAGFHHISRAKYLENHLVPEDGSIPEEAQPDYLQAALIAMDAHTGEIYALVGGRDFQESNFNRAVQAKRQPGSAFKPIVYATALKLGMTPATMMDASPMEFETVDGVYRPSNAGGEYYDPVTLRTALRKSINTVSVRLGQRVGIGNIIRTARAFGFQGELPAVISLPLGAAEVSLLEMVRAYSAFPDQGRIVQPSIIARIEGKHGEVLYRHHPMSYTALDEQTAFLITAMLTDAVDRGTGRGVRTAGFRLPAGGKTGTTNDSRDAWFIGFTPDVVTGIWVGFDMPQEIVPRGYGATLAVPIWANFMKQSFKESARKEFPMPAGIVRASICANSGQLANHICRSLSTAYSEYFTEGNAPQDYCTQHSDLYMSSTSEGSSLPSAFSSDGVMSSHRLDAMASEPTVRYPTSAAKKNSP